MSFNTTTMANYINRIYLIDKLTEASGKFNCKWCNIKCTYISDFCMVIIDTNLKKQSWTKSTLTIRDSYKFTTENLMANFTPPMLEMDVILDQAYDQFNTELQKMLDAVAPKKTIKQIYESKNPWLNKYIRQQRKVVKNRDIIWRKYKKDYQCHTYKKRETSTTDS